jgi:hypothetical protein
MDGLTIDIERCPDGVKLADEPAVKRPFPVPARTVFRYRTARRETKRITLENLEDPVVVAFVNATDDEGRQLFFGRFGLDSRHSGLLWGEPFAPLLSRREELHRDIVLQNQSRFEELIRNAGGSDPAVAMAAINSAISSRVGFSLQPTFHLAEPRGTPQLLLRSESILGFMLMEMAMIVAHGARMAECEKCGTVFLTGPLTWRRSHARFCSDRCRVAAMRARQAAAT